MTQAETDDRVHRDPRPEGAEIATIAVKSAPPAQDATPSLGSTKFVVTAGALQARGASCSQSSRGEVARASP